MRSKMVMFNLKRDKPQKYFMKQMCKILYCLGMGDYWYEKAERSKAEKILYTVWATIINGFLLLNILNELLANLRTDLTTKEKNDLIQFSMAHPSLAAKYLFLVVQKDRVKKLLERMLEDDPSTYRSLKVERKSVRKAIWYILSLGLITYGTLFMTTIDMVIAHVKDDEPFRVEVTLFPSRDQTGFYVSVMRFFVEFHWWCVVTNMVMTDGMAFTSLIYLQCKFKLVSMYFDEVRVKTQRNLETKSQKECAEEFEADFVTGIKMHENALWCARNVQFALGNIYGVQIIESITLLVMCLIKLVTLERNMMFLMANFLYITCILMLTGAYMMVAGDVTYEASQLATAMFHSGWELVKTRPRFRSLAVVAIARGQKPVHMTAFGVITLSHSNFISVIRSSYSFFAVMY